MTMQEKLFNQSIQCPYCWELIEVTVDDCGEQQEYIEDCQVCCRPIVFHIQPIESSMPLVKVYREDDAL